MIPHSRRETVIKREIDRIVTKADLQGRSNAYTGKRDSLRFTAGMQLDITKDMSDQRAVLCATMHDVSEGGISFWSRADIGLGDVVYVREFDAEGRGRWIKASVRHLTQGLQGFLVGVEFDAERDEGGECDAQSAPAM